MVDGVSAFCDDLQVGISALLPEVSLNQHTQLYLALNTLLNLTVIDSGVQC